MIDRAAAGFLYCLNPAKTAWALGDLEPHTSADKEAVNDALLNRCNVSVKLYVATYLSD